MKIKLKSDFIDIYDHWFCNSYEKEDVVFERFTNSGMNRLEMFKFLNNFYNVPSNHYWINSDNYISMYDDNQMIVYLDINSHCGENKIKITFKEYREKYQGYFASKYITPKEFGTSYRYLKIGERSFWLKYKSLNDWRSNCGDVSIQILDKNYDFNNIDFGVCVYKLNYPIFAIDFVKDKVGQLFALDFNVSPGLKHIDELCDLISKKEIYQQIENWFIKNDTSL